MKIRISNDISPINNISYDSYYNFYLYNSEPSDDTNIENLLHIRNDLRIYIQDDAGNCVDIVCNTAGAISSIAFRQELSQLPSGSLQRQIPGPSGEARMAVIADPHVEKHEVDRIAASCETLKNGRGVILLSLSDDRNVAWHPISNSAWVGVDDDMTVIAFLFSDTKFTDD